MRVVDLSNRPFVNRRPVARVSVLLWALAAVLLLVNLWMYTSYWSDAASSRARLAALDGELAAEQDRLVAGQQRLDRLALGVRNDQASFLNGLIDQRTFPWSQLFEDLEGVLPRDVRLLSVEPDLESADESTRSASRGRQATRGRSARNAARNRPRGTSRGAANRRSARSEAAAESVPEAAPEERVSLALPGSARDEDSLFALVETLYASERFANPFLAAETRQDGGDISFSIQVEYLVPRDRDEPATISVGGEAVAELDAAETEAAERRADELVAIEGTGDGQEARSGGVDPEDADPEDGALPRVVTAPPQSPAEENAASASRWSRPSSGRQTRPSRATSTPPASPRDARRSTPRVRETSRGRSTTVIPPALRARSAPEAATSRGSNPTSSNPTSTNPRSSTPTSTRETSRGQARDGSATSRGEREPLPRQREASGSPQVRLDGALFGETGVGRRLAQWLGGVDPVSASELRIGARS